MLRVRDIMSTDLATVSPELDLREAIDVLTRRHVTGAPVVAGGRLLGVMSATDVLEFTADQPGVPTEQRDQMEVSEWGGPEEWREGDESPSAYYSEWWTDVGADVSERFAETKGPEWDVLAEHTVGEVMTQKVCTVRPDATITAAATYMLTADVHRVLVVERGTLTGILTTTDIVRAVAQGRLVSRD
jgi:CBS domain-containing protein